MSMFGQFQTLFSLVISMSPSECTGRETEVSFSVVYIMIALYLFVPALEALSHRIDIARAYICLLTHSLVIYYTPIPSIILHSVSYLRSFRDGLWSAYWHPVIF